MRDLRSIVWLKDHVDYCDKKGPGDIRFVRAFHFPLEGAVNVLFRERRIQIAEYQSPQMRMMDVRCSFDRRTGFRGAENPRADLVYSI